MKFHGPLHADEVIRRKLWERWFAWHPVRVGVSREFVWWQWVERDGIMNSCRLKGWEYVYRLPNDPRPYPYTIESVLNPGPVRELIGAWVSRNDGPLLYEQAPLVFGPDERCIVLNEDWRYRTSDQREG